MSPAIILYILLAVLLSAVFFVLKGGIIAEEKVVFMRDIGIEIHKKYATGKTSKAFYSTTRLRDIIIYEHVSSLEVTNIIGLLLHKHPKTIILFEVKN